MNIYKKISIGMLLCAILVANSTDVLAKKQSAKKGKEKVEVKAKPLTAYEKLFKDKSVKTATGYMTLHLIDDKLIVELPRTMLGKDMLIGSTIEQISDMGDGSIGQQTSKPIHIRFAATDSLILVKSPKVDILRNIDDQQQESIDRSNINPTIEAYAIKCLTPDSLSYVFDATSMFLDMKGLLPIDENGYNSFGGLISTRLNYNSNKSLLKDVVSYGDNISVTALLTYSQNRSFLGMGSTGEGKPFTAVAKRSIWLLPDNVMEPRLADSRIGMRISRYSDFNPELQGSKTVYYANRWNLTPADQQAHKRGELVDPEKPITFYIDDSFPENLAVAVKEAIYGWNSSFEKIGFKNAIRIIPFSQADEKFDPNDIKYSCIKYLTSIDGNVRSNIWTDPRNGEILSVSIYVPYGALQELHTDYLLWLGAADPDIRSLNRTTQSVVDGLKNKIAQHTGLCLGLLPNYSASTATPVDSLRSATYTSKYGLSPSIMDDLPANFTAKQGDKEKGVLLVQTKPGCYDEYAIKWLYSYLHDTSNQQKTDYLHKIITDRSNDKHYLYTIKHKHLNLDPRTLTQDLGDDILKATKYRFDNLRYVLANVGQWIDKSDSTYSNREILIGKSFLHILYSIDDASVNIGGVYMNEKQSGDPMPSVEAVPKQVQQATLNFILSQIDDMQWMDSPGLSKDILRVVSSSDYCRQMCYMWLFSKIKRMDVSNSISDDPYTAEMAYNDVYKYVAKQIRAGKQPKPIEMMLVKDVLRNSNIREDKSKKKGLTEDVNQMVSLLNLLKPLGQNEHNKRLNELIQTQFGLESDDNDAMEQITRVNFAVPSNIDHHLYGMLSDIKHEYAAALKRTSDEELKNHYSYILILIDRALKID